MSLRQQTRLNQLSYLKKETDSDSSDGEIRTQPKFVFLDDDDSSSGDSSNDSDDDKTVLKSVDKSIKIDIASNSASSQKEHVIDLKIKHDNDIEFLNSLLTLNKQKESEIKLSEPTYQSEVLCFVDSDHLDVKKELNNRFAMNQPLEEDNYHNIGKRKQKHNRGVAKNRSMASAPRPRSLLFGPQEEGWVKPPSFIGGGFRTTRTSSSSSDSNSKAPSLQTPNSLQSFVIEWSVEYSRLNELYLLVQDTGDVNRLIMFLANHPYHVEGLFQLSLLFARIGLMDRATDLVRRCVFCLESSFADAFRPASGLCRLDPHVRENSIFFVVLFKHMQQCFVLGCVALAADICRLLLGLHPQDDAHYLLLTLDMYLLTAGQHDTLQAFCGANKRMSSQPSDGQSDGNQSDFVSYQPQNWFVLGDVDNSIGGSRGDRSNSSLDVMPSLDVLPNWWFSLALSTRMTEADLQRKKNYKGHKTNCGDDGTDSQTQKHQGRQSALSSSFLLKCALLRHPYMLEPLLGEAGVTVGVFANSTWRAVLRHDLFGGAASRLPPSSYLRNVSHIYSHRCGALWNSPEVHSWVLDCAREVIAHLDESEGLAGRITMQQQQEWRRLSEDSRLSHYNEARLENFAEEVQRMPNEVHNLIEPQLMDPLVLAGGVRFDPQHLGVQLNNRANRRNRHEEEQARLRADAERRRVAERDRFVLDLRLPLMQLFLATLLPWCRVNRPPALHLQRGGRR